MAQFYVSHAYEDRGFASTLISWLAEHAFAPGLSTFVRTPRFSDNQNHATQAVKAIQESDAVVMLCSKAWAACKQCYAEYVAAQASGKFVVALIIKKSGRDLGLAPDIPRFIVDKVGRDMTDMITVLSAFERADPYCYDWSPDRRPYPGIRAFNADEAGVFFGRDNDIQNVVARISARLVDKTNCLTLLVGPTGSGVSSLLAAGVLPALARNSVDSLILPVVRPRLQPVDALAVSIATALEAPENWRRWSDRLIRALSDDLPAFVESCVDELREHSGSANARIVIPIDQLEELFWLAEPEQARAFEAFVAVVSASDLPVHMVATVGSEHVKTFKNSRLGVCNWKPIAIEPIPLERYGDLIRGPAQRAGVLVEDTLVERLVADAGQITEDRLSLVAYLLRMFWRLEAPFGQFSNTLYERLSSGENGEIELPTLESAIALGAELAIEDANTSFESRTTIGPTLVNLAVRWDTNSKPVRTPFALEEVPRDKIALVDSLNDAGLVTKVKVGDQHLGEFSSAVLFRQWPRLERLVRAQAEGPDIVVSHCREVSCVVLPAEEDTKAPKRSWKRAASVVGESLTAAVCALALLAIVTPLGQGERSGAPAPQTVAAIAAPVADPTPAPDANRADETDARAIVPPSAQSTEHQSPTEPETQADAERQNIALASEHHFAERQTPAEAEGPIDVAQPVLLPVDDASAAHRTQTMTSARADAMPSVLQPAILPTELLSKVIDLEPPQAVRAEAPASAVEKEPVRPSAVELPELLEIIRAQTPSDRDTTQMLLAMEALLHPKAPLLTGQQRAALRSTIRQNLKQHFEPRSLRIHKGGLFAAAFSPGGKQIASASKDGIARLWDADDGAMVRTYNGHKGELYGVAYSRDGSKLVTTSRDRTARIWNTQASGKSVALIGHKGPVYRAEFDSDGKTVVTASADGQAIIWDAATGKRLRTLAGHAGPVWSAAFSRNGEKILTASKDKTARIWHSDTGTLVAKLMGHRADVVTGAFSPDGNTVATGSRDGSVRIWNASTGQETAHLVGHTRAVVGTQFSEDGLFLVTASFDGTARIWELATGQTVADFRAGPGKMRTAELSSDGKTLRTVSDDGTVSIWPVALTPSQLLDSVLQATNGCLSVEKRHALHLGGENPWWCRMSRVHPNADGARTEG